MLHSNLNITHSWGRLVSININRTKWRRQAANATKSTTSLLTDKPAMKASSHRKNMVRIIKKIKISTNETWNLTWVVVQECLPSTPGISLPHWHPPQDHKPPPLLPKQSPQARFRKGMSRKPKKNPACQSRSTRACRRGVPWWNWESSWDADGFVHDLAPR